MTIAEARERCKAVLGRIPRDAGVLAVLVLASSASFGLGWLEGRGQAARQDDILINIAPASPEASAEDSESAGKYVASKNGTKYYLATCSGASRISDTNKVWFDSEEAAQGAGYTPAANCPGI